MDATDQNDVANTIVVVTIHQVNVWRLHWLL